MEIWKKVILCMSDIFEILCVVTSQCIIQHWEKLLLFFIKMIVYTLMTFFIIAPITMFFINGMGHAPFNMFLNIIGPASLSVVMGIVGSLDDREDNIKIDTKNQMENQDHPKIEQNKIEDDIVNTKRIQPTTSKDITNIYSTSEDGFSDLQQSLNSVIQNIQIEPLQSEEKHTKTMHLKR